MVLGVFAFWLVTVTRSLGSPLGFELALRAIATPSTGNIFNDPGYAVVRFEW